ncbi:hypothetical protein MW887_007470 [Aspergillus wentii]|nr:hypothetical protein MW887_007470 [Aspergillus wentii]
MSKSTSDLNPISGQSPEFAAKEAPLQTANPVNLSEKDAVVDNRESSIDGGLMKPVYDHTRRKLKPRHIQLIGIGGTIGTALYVQIGEGLRDGGPGSLFLAFTIWCSVILAITVCLAEMVTYLPISSPFIRFASRFVDDAFGVAAGYNFFVFEAIMVPFEVTACHMIITYWSSIVPVSGIIAIILVLFILLNVFAVQWYGEAEFWLALGKVLLSVGLLFFTFIVMLGGNPLGDRFGFRYWNNPGSFAEYYKTGSLGRWLGFLACLIRASFTIAGPDYVSMAAGETINPRSVLPKAYNGVFYRLTSFFVLGALSVGILVPFNDPTMSDAFDKDLPGAAASPYVIAMDRLHIPVLPHIVNAMILGACFSAGIQQFVCRFRLVTASQLINFSVCTFTYIRFKKALEAQGISRDSLPYKGRGQPYVAYIALTATTVMAFVGGYTVFLPGNWSVPTFLFSYTMIGVFPVIYFGWKFIHKTEVKKLEDIDLVTGVAEIDDYTRNFVTAPPGNVFSKTSKVLFD